MTLYRPKPLLLGAGLAIAMLLFVIAALQESHRYGYVYLVTAMLLGAVSVLLIQFVAHFLLGWPAFWEQPPKRE